MTCDVPDDVISTTDVIKVVFVDILMVLSLAGNVTCYVSYSRRQGKLTPAQVLLRFIFGFGAVFAGLNALGFTLETFCGKYCLIYS